MNATKLAPAVLICIVVLVAISSVGFALSQSLTQGAAEALGEDNTAVNKVWKIWIQRGQLQGDPIGDPRPNKYWRV